MALNSANEQSQEKTKMPLAIWMKWAPGWNVKSGVSGPLLNLEILLAAGYSLEKTLREIKLFLVYFIKNV